MLVADYLYSEPNDGAVACSDCMVISDSFASVPSAAFYVGDLNHYDVTCLYGDGDAEISKPCTWFSMCD